MPDLPEQPNSPIKEPVPGVGISRRDFLLGEFGVKGGERKAGQEVPDTIDGRATGNGDPANSGLRVFWERIGVGGRLAAAFVGLMALPPRDKAGEIRDLGPKVDRRNALKALSLLLLALATGCTPGGNSNPDRMADLESGITPEGEGGFDALKLLEKDEWTADEFLSYIAFAGIGGYLSYKAAETFFDMAYEDPRQAFIREVWAAANRGDNRNFRRDMRAIFESVDNTTPAAHGYIIPNGGLENPKNFRAWSFRNSDDTFPRSWTEAELNLADTADVTEPYFGGFTKEYVKGPPINGIDLSVGELRFLGEPRDSKLIAISHTDPSGVTRELIVPRNVVFPGFNKDQGYRLIDPNTRVEVIMTHLEARHPITQLEIDGLFNGLGETSSAKYVTIGPKTDAYFQIGVQSDGQLFDIIVKHDAEAAELFRRGQVNGAINRLVMKNRAAAAEAKSEIVTAYQPYSRIRGQNRGVLGLIDKLRGQDEATALLNRRIRGVESFETAGSNVFEVLESGEWVQMPKSGPWDIRLAAQLGRYIRAYPRFGEKIMNFTRRLQELRPIISPVLGMIGAAVCAIGEQALRESIPVTDVIRTFQPLENFATMFDPYGSGEYHTVGPDRYISNMLLPLGNTPDFIDPSTGVTQLEPYKVVQLPPIHGLPSDPLTSLLPYLATIGVTPMSYKPWLGQNFPAMTDPELIQQLISIGQNPFAVGVNPKVMSYIYGCLNGPFLAENSFLPETGSEGQEALANQLPLGVPTIPVPYGEHANIGIYRHEDGTLRFTLIDYTVDGGITPGSPDLGIEFEVPVTVCPIRDLVHLNGGDYEETLRNLTPDMVQERTATFSIKYSIINNNSISITVSRI